MKNRQTYRHTQRGNSKPVHFREAVKCPFCLASHPSTWTPYGCTGFAAIPSPPEHHPFSAWLCPPLSLRSLMCSSPSVPLNLPFSPILSLSLTSFVSVIPPLSLYFVICFSASHAQCHPLCIDLCLFLSFGH